MLPCPYRQPRPGVRVRPRRRARDRFLLPAEWLRLRAVLDRQPLAIRVYFLLLLLTGCRPGEARLMRWEHLDLDAALWYKPRTKTGRGQHLALSPQAVALLRSLDPTGLWVFRGDRRNGRTQPDQPWSRTAIQHAWRRIRGAAGLADVQLRDLRRTCASWLAMGGANTVTIQQVLNHASLQVTQVYARLDQRTVRDGLTVLAQRLFSPRSGSTP